MGKLGKYLLAFAGVAVVVGGVSAVLLPTWNDYLWIPFGVFGIFTLANLIIERRFYFEFLTLKTTKHGMNMGVMIVLFIALVVGVNYIAYDNNAKWDWTAEGLNSLSEQSEKVLSSLDDTLIVKAFFRQDQPGEERLVGQLREVIDLYRDENKNVSFDIVNPIKRPDVAKEFDVDASGTIILKYKGNQTAITEISEEAITNAIVKITREEKKKIYFITGHGELDIESTEAQGASSLKEALRDSAYDVASLNLVSQPEIPSDAHVVAIPGPKNQLFDAEIKIIEDYLAAGGHVFVAADPGARHGIDRLLRKVGVQFKGDYIIDPIGQMMGGSAALAAGMQFSPTSDITKSFAGANSMTVFQLASTLSESPVDGKDFKYEDLVQSGPGSFAKQNISGKIRLGKDDVRGPFTIGMQVSGSLSSKVEKASDNLGDSAGKRDFILVAFGDSDFMSNQLIDFQLNRNLVLNVFSFLAADDDLISIRPKSPKGTKLAMTGTQANIIMLSVLGSVLLAWILALVLWLRRRGA